MKKLAVVAFGGNALLRSNQRGTIDEQEKNVLETCEKVLELVKRGYNLVITYGNGPQVGNILLRNDAGYNQYKIEKMPLDICVADSQGEIGYMIERQMHNAMNAAGMDRSVISLMTQVLVDGNDPAFGNPTKPIGPFYLKEEAELLALANNWVFKEDPRKRGWRKVVASPPPLDIINKNVIKELAEAGHIVVAAGGGGIPVYRHEDNYLEAIEAVIDKDLASSLLASDIKADEFYILTDVPKVCINFNTKKQKQIDVMTIAEAEGWLKEGQFAEGSMGPKVKAAINFVKSGGGTTIITEAGGLNDAKCGTRIIKEI